MAVARADGKAKISPMVFTDVEIERYARHLVLREVGGPGQQKLKAASALIVGAGGLGSPVALYLAAAGVGTLILVDPDDVDRSNLQRQILYADDDVGGRSPTPPQTGWRRSTRISSWPATTAPSMLRPLTNYVRAWTWCWTAPTTSRSAMRSTPPACAMASR